MRPAICPQETNVLKAVRTGIWEEALSMHVAACADCKEAARAARWMQGLARSAESMRALPDSGRVWWRAQVSEKEAKAERAQELFEWAEIISTSAICAGLASWIVWDWIAIQTRATLYLAGAWPHSWLSTSLALGTAPTIFSLGVVIVSVVAIVLAYPMLARD